MIKTIKADGSEKEFLAGMKKRSSEVNAEVEKTVRAIIDDVAARGDEAVKEYTARFDCPNMQYYRVPDEVIQDALTNADPDFVNSMLNAQENITAFHTRQKQNGYMMTDESGCILGQRVRGLDRVGLYVPGRHGGLSFVCSYECYPCKDCRRRRDHYGNSSYEGRYAQQ